MKLSHRPIGFTFLAMAVVASAYAQAAAAAPAPTPSTATALLNLLLNNGPLLTAIYAAIATGIAYWKHNQGAGYKAALGATVLGVESFTSTAAGKAVEDQLKSAIQATAEKHGAEGVLHEAVTLLTPAVTAEAAKLTAPSITAPTPNP